MLQTQSMVVVADNSWAKKAMVIRVLKWSFSRKARIGDSVVVAIKESTPGSSVKKWDVMTAIVVRVRKEIARKDGTYLRFGDNAVVLMTKNDKGEMSPVWKRVFGPVARELRERWLRNITNMAEEVL